MQCALRILWPRRTMWDIKQTQTRLMCMHHHPLLVIVQVFTLRLPQGGLNEMKWLVYASYSDSPHRGNYLHPAAGATHLQTANVLQNVRDGLKDCQFEEAKVCFENTEMVIWLFRAAMINRLGRLRYFAITKTPKIWSIQHHFDAFKLQFKQFSEVS